MTDLYYVMTNYQLLDCLLHKITLNKKNNADILLSSFLVFHNPELLNTVKKTGIFDRVDVYEETIFSYEENINIKEEIDSICNAVGEGYGYILNKYNDIYLGQDHNSLGVFLVSKKREFYYFEDASGTYSNPDILLNIIKSENKNRYDIIKKLKLGGRSKFVKKVYCDFEHQKNNFDDSLCIDFSIKKILKKLNSIELNKILEVYHCHKYDLRKQKKDLLLTWHYNNMRMMTLDEQRDFFSLLVDYFKNEKDILFIKPHPSDKLPDYKKWFKDAIVLERHMPSELLPFCVEGKFEKGITNWSTSIFGLQEVLKDVVNFDKDIDFTYRDFHKYFAVVMYLDAIKNKEKTEKLILKNINKIQLYQLMRRYIDNYELYYEFASEGEGIHIADKYDETLKDKRCIIINGLGNFAPHGIMSIIAGEREECVFLKDLPDTDLYIEKEMTYSGYTLRVASRGVSEYIDYLENRLDAKKTEIIQITKDDQKKIDELTDKVKNYREQRDILRVEVDNMLGSSSWKITKPLRKINSLRRKK